MDGSKRGVQVKYLLVMSYDSLFGRDLVALLGLESLLLF